MQALGRWPSLEPLTTPATLAQVFDVLAEYARDDERASVLRRAGDRARGFGGTALRQAIVRAGAPALRAAIGPAQVLVAQPRSSFAVRHRLVPEAV